MAGKVLDHLDSKVGAYAEYQAKRDEAAEKKVGPTPGPWKVTDRPQFGIAVWAVDEHLDGTHAICPINVASPDKPIAVARANAALIAAAPDLLEACKALLEDVPVCICHEGWTGRGLSDPNCGYCAVKNAVEQANAAIAKAESGAG